jgi:hypothetical protein
MNAHSRSRSLKYSLSMSFSFAPTRHRQSTIQIPDAHTYSTVQCRPRVRLLNLPSADFKPPDLRLRLHPRPSKRLLIITHHRRHSLTTHHPTLSLINTRLGLSRPLVIFFVPHINHDEFATIRKSAYTFSQASPRNPAC